MTDINKHIEKLITMLQSPRSGTRYEACEYLRIAPAITPEAIIALQNALNDSDADVAEAAQRALAVQLPPEPSREAPSQQTSPLNRIDPLNRIEILTTILSGFAFLALGVLVFFVGYLPRFGNSPCGPIGILLFGGGWVGLFPLAFLIGGYGA